MEKIIRLFLYTAIIMAVVSCSKDDSTGQKDLAEPVGIVGPAGPAGEDGKSGSVIYSGTTTPDISIGNVGDFFLNSNTGLLYGPKTANGWETTVSLKGEIGETGAAGPAGPAGPTGPAGPAGKPGSQILTGFGIPNASIGASGDYYLDKSGFAIYGPKTTLGWGLALSLQAPSNAFYSGWNYARNLRDTVMDGSNFSIADLPAPALSANLLNTAIVHVYFAFANGIHPLPYTSFSGGKQNTISYHPRVKHFMITRFTSDNSNSVQLSSMVQYRYLIIPGGTFVGKLPNLTDYEAVKKFYNIPE